MSSKFLVEAKNNLQYILKKVSNEPLANSNITNSLVYLPINF